MEAILPKPGHNLPQTQEAFDTATNLGEKSDIMRLEILEQAYGCKLSYLNLNLNPNLNWNPNVLRHDN